MPCLAPISQATICKGILIHGPLLGWAKVVGDSIFCYEQTVPNRQETISYLMPRRHGLEFGLYPWHAHLKDAVKGTKGMLTALGEWHHAVQDVREAGSDSRAASDCPAAVVLGSHIL